MAVKLIIAPEVEFDIIEAYTWYEERRAGLGEEFLSCIDACIHAICRAPELYAVVHQGDSCDVFLTQSSTSMSIAR